MALPVCWVQTVLSSLPSGFPTGELTWMNDVVRAPDPVEAYTPRVPSQPTQPNMHHY